MPVKYQGHEVTSEWGVKRGVGTRLSSIIPGRMALGLAHD